MPIERQSKTSDMTATSSKESGETGKLERLRNSHRFKDAMTLDQQETQDHQAHAKWQENEYKAMQDGAEERANQPWRPENRMQLTSAYQHRAQHGSGVLAGTQEEADRYWDNPNSARDTNEYWRIFYLPPGEASSSSNQDETARSGEASSSSNQDETARSGEASSSSNRSETAQSGEASSNNDTGLSGEKRQAIRSLLLSESYHRMRDSKKFAKSIQDVSEAKQCLNYLKSLKGSAFQDIFINSSTFPTRIRSLSRYIKDEWNI